MSTSMSDSSALDSASTGLDPGESIAPHDRSLHAHDATASLWDAIREGLRGSHRDFTGDRNSIVTRLTRFRG